MPDDKTKPGSPDTQRVNINEPYEVRDWAKKWGVTEAQLREAHAAVGPMANKIEAYLRQKGYLKK